MQATGCTMLIQAEYGTPNMACLLVTDMMQRGGSVGERGEAGRSMEDRGEAERSVEDRGGAWGVVRIMIVGGGEKCGCGGL